MIKAMLVAGVGGFVGTCLRYLVGIWARGIMPGLFPWGTFLVNAVGCLIIGIVFGLCERSEYFSQLQVVLFTTGFCGGFTTFSAFANEAFTMGARGQLLLSGLYVVASVAIGIFCVWLGRAAVRAVIV